MRDPVATSKNTEKFSSRDTAFFLGGVVLGIFLLIYSVTVSKNMAYTLFGAAIIVMEIVIHLKERAKHRSYIAVFDDGVEGIAVSSANAMITVSFSLPFSAVHSAARKGEMIEIVTAEGSYVCRAGIEGGAIYRAINDRLDPK